MAERLTLPQREVRDRMIRIEPKASHTEELVDRLSQTCIGQEEAMATIARRMTLAESGINDTDRPLGVMLFAGQTGVGKTEASHAVAKEWFGDRNSDRLKIIDCTEYQQDHFVTRFTGAPPSYVGYNAEPVITKDFLAERNIIVLDEFEKAHPDFHRLWLQVFEDARMSVKKGDPLDFQRSLIILTSNAGAEEMAKVGSGNMAIGFGNSVEEAHTPEGVAHKALKERFREMPELLGRIDDIVVFRSLEAGDYDRIFDKMLREKNEALKDRMEIEAPYFGATDEFKTYILTSIDTQYGARDLRKTLDRELFHPSADLFLGQELKGHPIVADREEDQTVFYTDEIEELCETDEEPLHIHTVEMGTIIEFPFDRKHLQQ